MKCINCFSENVAGGQCRNCGSPQSESHRDRRALPVGYVLGKKYFIGRILGSGGFGITYLALDETLNRRVALKEYIPNELASRARNGITIFCHSSADESPYQQGLRRFFHEGEMIAKFDHPNIVRAFEVFEANGTAYLAMEFLEGRTLRNVLEERKVFSVEQALDVMTFVMDALKVIHKKHVVHRDLKPDNIYLTNEGRTLLLDFGGAKEIVGEHSHSMTAIFSHGYAAPEQYHGDETKSGPWTDVYGCAALIYKLITGNTPPSALERYNDDVVLDWKGASVRQGVKDAIARAMVLKVSNRVQDIDTLQRLLKQSEPVQSTSRQKNPSLGIQWILGTTFIAVLFAGVVYVFNSQPSHKSENTIVPVRVPERQGVDLKNANTANLPTSKLLEVPTETVIAPSAPVIQERATEKPKPVSTSPSRAAERRAAALEASAKAAEEARAQEEARARAAEETQKRKEEAMVSAILGEGESCFAVSKFDCAISSANAALRVSQQDPKAIALRERAIAAQKRALEGIRIQ